MSSDNRRHVFISHHHKDDSSVDGLTQLLKSKGYDIRNSSIRAKPANQARIDKGLVADNVIKRLLRMKIAWSGAVIVLVGSQTHTRPWVNWEIQKAHESGKRIIGVYERGGTDYPLPENLKKYGSNCVAWNVDSIISAVDGTDAPFQDASGGLAPPIATSVNIDC